MTPTLSVAGTRRSPRLAKRDSEEAAEKVPSSAKVNRRSLRQAKRNNEEAVAALAEDQVPPSAAKRRTRKTSQPSLEPKPTTAPNRRHRAKRKAGKLAGSPKRKRRRLRSPSPNRGTAEPSAALAATAPVNAVAMAPAQDPPTVIPEDTADMDEVVVLDEAADMDEAVALDTPPAVATPPRHSRYSQRSNAPNRRVTTSLVAAPAVPAVAPAAPVLAPAVAQVQAPVAAPAPIAALVVDAGNPWKDFAWMVLLFVGGFSLLGACKFTMYTHSVMHCFITVGAVYAFFEACKATDLTDRFVLVGAASAFVGAFKKAKTIWKAREVIVSPPEPEYHWAAKHFFAFVSVFCFAASFFVGSAYMDYSLTSCSMLCVLQLLRILHSTLLPIRFHRRLSMMYKNGLSVAAVVYFLKGKLMISTAMAHVTVDICVWSLFGGPGSTGEWKKRARPFITAADFLFGTTVALVKFLFGMPFALVKFIFDKNVAAAKLLGKSTVAAAKILGKSTVATAKILGKTAWDLDKKGEKMERAICKKGGKVVRALRKKGRKVARALRKKGKKVARALGKKVGNVASALGKKVGNVAWALFVAAFALFMAVVAGVIAIVTAVSFVSFIFQNFWLVQQPWLTNYMERVVVQPYYVRPKDHSWIIEDCRTLHMEYETKLTRSNVNKAFRKASLIHHPDKGGTDEDFERLSDARDSLLTNPVPSFTYSRTWLFQEPCLVSPHSYYPVCSMEKLKAGA